MDPMRESSSTNRAQFCISAVVVFLAACSAPSESGTATPPAVAATTPSSGGVPAGGAPAVVTPMSGGSGPVSSGAGGVLGSGGQTMGSGGAPGGAPSIGGMPPIPSAGAPSVGGGGAGGAPMGAGGMMPAVDPNTVAIQMDAFTVGPGEEVFMCQDFDNPFGGVDTAVGRTESNMTVGSHHLHVFYGVDGTSRTVAACPDPNEFRPLIHLATIPNLVTAYPPGMAAKLKGSVGLRMQVHYVNSGIDPLQAQVSLKLSKVDPSTIQKWVAQMHFNRTSMQVPPG